LSSCLKIVFSLLAAYTTSLYAAKVEVQWAFRTESGVIFTMLKETDKPMHFYLGRETGDTFYELHGKTSNFHMMGSRVFSLQGEFVSPSKTSEGDLILNEFAERISISIKEWQGVLTIAKIWLNFPITSINLP
jgi:hypothetical protein